MQNFEDSKRREMKRLEESLEEVAESSKKAKEDVDKERGSLDRVKSEFRGAIQYSPENCPENCPEKPFKKYS